MCCSLLVVRRVLCCSPFLIIHHLFYSSFIIIIINNNSESAVCAPPLLLLLFFILIVFPSSSSPIYIVLHLYRFFQLLYLTRILCLSKVYQKWTVCTCAKKTKKTCKTAFARKHHLEFHKKDGTCVYSNGFFHATTYKICDM